jgi:hypothetical protein
MAMRSKAEKSLPKYYNKAGGGGTCHATEGLIHEEDGPAGLGDVDDDGDPHVVIHAPPQPWGHQLPVGVGFRTAAGLHGIVRRLQLPHGHVRQVCQHRGRVHAPRRVGIPIQGNPVRWLERLRRNLGLGQQDRSCDPGQPCAVAEKFEVESRVGTAG